MKTREIAITSFFFALVLALQEFDMPALHFPGLDVEVEIPDAVALLAVVALGWRAGFFLGIADGIGDLPLAAAIIPKSIVIFALSGYLARHLGARKWTIFLIYLPLDVLTSAVFFNLAYGVPVITSMGANLVAAVPGAALGLFFWFSAGGVLRRLVEGVPLRGR
jgi:hypothetical protein